MARVLDAGSARRGHADVGQQGHQGARPVVPHEVSTENHVEDIACPIPSPVYQARVAVGQEGRPAARQLLLPQVLGQRRWVPNTEEERRELIQHGPTGFYT